MKINTNACNGTDTEVNYLEHVQAVITANASRRGDLEIFLNSPMGTRSMILSKRVNDDDHRDGFTKWPFMTTHTWGEYPQGIWTLEVCSFIHPSIHSIYSQQDIISYNILSHTSTDQIQLGTTADWLAKRMVIGAARHKGATISNIVPNIPTFQIGYR